MPRESRASCRSEACSCRPPKMRSSPTSSRALGLPPLKRMATAVNGGSRSTSRRLQRPTRVLSPTDRGRSPRVARGSDGNDAMFGPIHHVGYVVGALEPAERNFLDLGYERLGPAIEDAGYDAEIVFLGRSGATSSEPLVELIRPLTELSSVYSHLRESKLQIHHLCFAVDDLPSAIVAARTARFYKVGGMRPAPAIGGRSICFFFGRGVGLFELVERPPFGPAPAERPLPRA